MEYYSIPIFHLNIYKCKYCLMEISAVLPGWEILHINISSQYSIPILTYINIAICNCSQFYVAREYSISILTNYCIQSFWNSMVKKSFGTKLWDKYGQPWRLNRSFAKTPPHQKKSFDHIYLSEDLWHPSLLPTSIEAQTH